MRKVIEYCLVSADGIMLEDPFPFRDHLDDAYLRDRLGLFAACDAMLSMTRGSQSSSTAVKWWRNTTGTPFGTPSSR